MEGGQIRKGSLTGPLIILGIFILYVLAGIYADWLWFESVKYLFVYKKALLTRIGLGIAVFALFFVVLAIQLLILSKQLKNPQKSFFWRIILGISLLAGITASSFWMVVLKYANYTPFGFVDPLFAKDISFYIFEIPFFEFVLLCLFFLLVISVVFTAALSSLSIKAKAKPKPIDPEKDPLSQIPIPRVKLEFPKYAKLHLAILGGLLLFVVACFLYLKRYSVLFSHRGAVWGAGFTDVTIMIPLYTILAIVALILGGIALLYGYLQNTRLLAGGLTLLVVIFFVGTFVSGLVQALYVEPNEQQLESKYLEENIKHTLFAYKLSDVQTRDFSISYNLTSAVLNDNQATMDNVRLWDWRPLLTTYKQIQLFRTYYDFLDVDVDRYMIDGQLRQLMVSPRELDTNQLDTAAKTWVNEHFVYTHGYGAVISPVNRVTAEGLPDLLVQDIPPKSTHDIINIDQPRIYFGEKTDQFVVVKTKNQDGESNEFDYPLGNDNQFADYNGQAGITLSNFIKRAVFSLKFGSLNLLVSSAITDESKVMLYRNILQRVNVVAPFLELDSDPYIVVVDGKMYWMMDAYTTTNRFPYSEPAPGTTLNYVRNSVKIVVDAFHGSMDFYVIDKEDPLVANYASMFPNLFKPIEEMPEGLLAHIRYPEGLMRVQTQMYGVYHMTDPKVFYNKEDVWRTPTEKYGRTEVDLRPYHVILKLPGAEREGFFLITPLIPRGKENLIAWFAAHSDPQDYGKLEVFELSKQELTYGPMQIEARIDQDPEISQLLTLWGQQGSEVIRGNLLIIPIEESFLYIEPIYLKASASGALPELKRVIVAYEDQVTMQETLADSLNVIFGGEIKKIQRQIETGTAPQSLEEKFNAASVAYDQAQEALQQGDFTAYAERIEEVGRLLSE